jgi:hypothetical protein
MISLFVIPFFLLSHTKKEKIRALVPFRLSDTQVVVFVISILVMSLVHLLLMSPIFNQFAIHVDIGTGFLIAMSSSICILFSAFFLSKKTKEESIEIRHIDHREVLLSDEYAEIL